MNRILIASVCHAVNAAYCLSLGDTSQAAWADAPEWQKASTLAGVDMHLANPDATPENSHESWLAQKTAEGWKYGEVKDPAKKEHPCFMPYADLPAEQKAKDYLFRAVVHALKDLPDAAAPSSITLAAAPATAPPVLGFTPIRYIGKREPHVDGAYGTRILWACRGDTQLVPDATAIKMLGHLDVYERGEAATDAVAPVAPKKKVDDSDEPSQVARDMVNTMGKDALETYARTNFKVELDKRQKVSDLRSEVTSLIDRFGIV